MRGKRNFRQLSQAAAAPVSLRRIDRWSDLEGQAVLLRRLRTETRARQPDRQSDVVQQSADFRRADRGLCWRSLRGAGDQSAVALYRYAGNGQTRLDDQRQE